MKLFIKHKAIRLYRSGMSLSLFSWTMGFHSCATKHISNQIAINTQLWPSRDSFASIHRLIGGSFNYNCVPEQTSHIYPSLFHMQQSHSVDVVSSPSPFALCSPARYPRPRSPPVKCSPQSNSRSKLQNIKLNHKTNKDTGEVFSESKTLAKKLD